MKKRTETTVTDSIEPKLELKPCPFCGYEFADNVQQVVIEYNVHDGTQYAFVQCWGCNAEGPYTSKGIRLSIEHLAILAWNRRND